MLGLFCVRTVIRFMKPCMREGGASHRTMFRMKEFKLLVRTVANDR